METRGGQYMLTSAAQGFDLGNPLVQGGIAIPRDLKEDVNTAH
jgi:hypothetical protein